MKTRTETSVTTDGAVPDANNDNSAIGMTYADRDPLAHADYGAGADGFPDRDDQTSGRPFRLFVFIVVLFGCIAAASATLGAFGLAAIAGYIAMFVATFMLIHEL